MSTSELLVKVSQTKKIDLQTTPELIITFVCEFFDLKKSKVLTKSRKRNLVFVRQICQTLIHESCYIDGNKITLYGTSKYFNRENHATILHSKKTVGDRAYIDPIDRETIFNLLNFLHNRGICLNLTLEKIITLKS